MEEAEETHQVQQPCIFCGIVSKKIPSNLVYEDDSVVAFLDINPLTEGHTLVIPKTHVMNIFDISEEELKHISLVAQRIANKMKETGQAEGINLAQANGEMAGQSVFHFHLHVIPRKTGDGLDFREWWLSRAKKADPEKLAELAAKLRTDVEKPKVVEAKVEEKVEELERTAEETEWLRREIGIA